MSDYQIAQQDAFEFLGTMPDASVDLINTDPPYSSLEKWRSLGTTTRLSKSKGSNMDWFATIPNSSFPQLMAEFYRVLKKDRHLYLYCDQETMFIVKPIAEQAGFKFWKPLVWDKVNQGMGYHFRCRYEFILFFEKGKRKVNNLSTPDILTFKRIKGGYSTEKPAELNEVLTSMSTQPGETVLDPFMGSASAGVAALRLGRKFIGCDIADESLRLAHERLGAASGTPQLSQPAQVQLGL